MIEGVYYGRRISQLAITVLANPTIVTKRKFRCTSLALIPFIDVAGNGNQIEHTYTKDLLFPQYTHVSLVGCCSFVPLRNAKVLVEIPLSILDTDITLWLLSRRDDRRALLHCIDDSHLDDIG